MIEGVITEIPIKIMLAPRPTCWSTDKDGTLKKEYKTPKRIPKPDNETDDPTINRINSDFLFGVDWLSLMASSGLTWDAFLAGNNDENIVTTTPIIIPVTAALGVKTKGPSGRPKSKYFSPSLTTTDKPMPSATPRPEPITAIYNDSETTSL